MKVCIRCNPRSILQEDADGLFCPIHGRDYWLEEQPDPVESEAEAAEEAPASAPAKKMAAKKVKK